MLESGNPFWRKPWVTSIFGMVLIGCDSFSVSLPVGCFADIDRLVISFFHALIKRCGEELHKLIVPFGNGWQSGPVSGPRSLRYNSITPLNPFRIA